MFRATKVIRQELETAKAQLAAARAARVAGGERSSYEQLALIERVEYFRGRVDAMNLTLALIARVMRQEAAEQ